METEVRPEGGGRILTLYTTLVICKDVWAWPMSELPSFASWAARRSKLVADDSETRPSISATLPFK